MLPQSLEHPCSCRSSQIVFPPGLLPGVHGQREEGEERLLGLHLKTLASTMTSIHKKRFIKEKHLIESNNILEKNKREKSIIPLVTKFLAVCPRRNSLLWPCWQVSYTRPLSCPSAHPGPRIHESSVPSKSISVLKEGSTLPHRPLVSPYVFRAMDTIFSSHVILVSLRMLYHTIPAGRTSSLRQKR